MATKPTQMRFPPDLLERIDRARGDRTRTAFVVEAVGRALDRAGDAPSHEAGSPAPLTLERRPRPPLDLVEPAEECAHIWKWKGYGSVCETCGALKVRR